MLLGSCDLLKNKILNSRKHALEWQNDICGLFRELFLKPNL